MHILLQNSHNSTNFNKLNINHSFLSFYYYLSPFSSSYCYYQPPFSSYSASGSSKNGLSIIAYPFLRLILCICDPFTMMSPSSLVCYSLPSTPITSWVLFKIKFIDLSQLFRSPYTSRPPLNFTTIVLFYSSISFMMLYFGMRIFRPNDAIFAILINKRSSLITIESKIVPILNNNRYIKVTTK